MMKKTVLALALLATTASAFAADSVDVRVIGTIVPAACTPSLSGGGTVDYGTIKADTISATSYTVLPEKQVPFSIVCDAPAKVALSVVNGRPGTLAGSTSTGNGILPVGVFGGAASSVVGAGLGMDGTAKIGGYGLRIDSSTVTLDGVAADVIRREAGSVTTWSADAVGSLYNNGSRQTTFSAPASTTPQAFQALAGQIGVQAYINKGSELDLSKPVRLDGLSTIELVYL
ncbi:DUF1120 domain-containing protein [Erwinia aphidicola]|uniref:DUF1120 domain-containing protein n=1 Tax=Erwinia aphidicola TaxID=68334 RepID=UPI003D22D0C3